MSEAKHKHIGDAAIQLDAKIEKYQSKRSSSGAEYDKLNEKAKVYATNSKAKHYELVDSIIVTAAVCQAELFRMAAAELEKVRVCVSCLCHVCINHCLSLLLTPLHIHLHKQTHTQTHTHTR